jgi:hypothetical protein
MEIDERPAGDAANGVSRPRTHLFAVRLWKQGTAGASEYRGSVREVISGAFRNFRDWSELAAFMTAQLEDDEGARAAQTEGGT